MIKRSTLFFTCLSIAIGVALFHIKYQVVALEKEYTQTLHHIRDTREAIHVLKAEWSHLNDPKRLQKLAHMHLHIQPIRGHQFISLKQFAKDSSMYDQYALDQLIGDVANTPALPRTNTASYDKEPKPS